MAKPVKSKTVKAKATPANRAFAPTGAAVARMRKQLGMTRARFADLIGVSPQTIANWEGTRGKLKLQKRTLAALTRADSQK